MNKWIILFIMIFLLMLSATLLYSHKLADLENLAKPEMMVADSSRLYILDGVKVYIYSMKDFRLLGELGKKGNGPGEFNPTFTNRIQLQLHDGNILLNSWNKMAWFSQEGKLIQEKKFPFPHPYLPAARYFTTNGNTLIIETFLKKENRSQFMVLDLEGKTLNKVYLEDAEPGRVKMSPTAGYTFYKNQHLFLKENIDTETWELHAEAF